MNNIIAFVKKVWAWIKVNLASILDAVQVVIKAVKTLVTAVINLLSIFFPTIGAQKAVLATRAFLETIDAGVEWLKAKLIPSVA